MHLFATAPREAPTTRGFASILVQGLAGLTADEVLAVPDDYPQTIGLTQAVSPLRIRGMTALLGRTKRQVREKIARLAATLGERLESRRCSASQSAIDGVQRSSS